MGGQGEWFVESAAERRMQERGLEIGVARRGEFAAYVGPNAHGYLQAWPDAGGWRVEAVVRSGLASLQREQFAEWAEKALADLFADGPSPSVWRRIADDEYGGYQALAVLHASPFDPDPATDPDHIGTHLGAASAARQERLNEAKTRLAVQEDRLRLLNEAKARLISDARKDLARALDEMDQDLSRRGE